MAELASSITPRSEAGIDVGIAKQLGSRLLHLDVMPTAKVILIP
jgi:hypothetical protein